MTPSVPPAKVPYPPQERSILQWRDEVEVRVVELINDLYRDISGSNVAEYKLRDVLRTLESGVTGARAMLDIHRAEAEVERRKQHLRSSADRVKDAEEKLAALKGDG